MATESNHGRRSDAIYARASLQGMRWVRVSRIRLIRPVGTPRNMIWRSWSGTSMRLRLGVASRCDGCTLKERVTENRA